jgi:hypothetical protein
MSLAHPGHTGACEDGCGDVKPCRRLTTLASISAFEDQANRNRDECDCQTREPLSPTHRAARIAATRPAMLKVSACTVGVRPSSLVVAVVIGPMLAIFTPASFVL